MEETVPVNRFHLVRDVSQIYVMYTSNRIIFERIYGKPMYKLN